MPPGGGPAGAERVNVFPVDDRLLFRHYFEGDRLFARLREYYENQQYRFAVPAGEFAAVRRFLGERGYWLVVVENPAEFVVAVRQYTAHPDGIFEHSVLQRARDGHNLFLLKDAEAVGEMAAAGATPLPGTDLAVPFDTSVADDVGRESTADDDRDESTADDDRGESATDEDENESADGEDGRQTD